MASNRHLGRIVALQSIFEIEFRSELEDEGLDNDEVVERSMGRYDDALDDKQFVRDLVSGTWGKASELDDILSPLAPERPFELVARIDRNVLRIACYELLFAKEDLPHRVVINEAVELAKSFGGENAARFINGVLGSLHRQHLADGESDQVEQHTKGDPDVAEDITPKEAQKAQAED